MSFLRRLFPTDPRPQAAGYGAPIAGSAGEVELVHGIIARLDGLPPDRARFVACAAYVIARAASADAHVSDQASRYMERVLVDQTGLDAAEAALVVETAKLQALSTGGTDDFVVTREFKRVSTPEQRLDILRACFSVAAIDGSIDAAESFTLDEIALEFDLELPALARLRGEFAERFSAVQALKDRPTAGSPAAPPVSAEAPAKPGQPS